MVPQSSHTALSLCIQCVELGWETGPKKAYAQQAGHHASPIATCPLKYKKLNWQGQKFLEAQVNLMAEAKSPYVARITCLEVSIDKSLLLCGDAGGSVIAFALPTDPTGALIATGSILNLELTAGRIM